ncbi:hypothetical protein EJ02DRAFT_508142 [Clathrospora elynae]|uniref:MARVEL domain-containing protein n=1 Tax=Clathrospora elynae TaxID=706981 RepID=A0A6A5T9C9_9PLEO|nr:hypothetical protein EJ02DRAFT_508142 [Clathrospora elynae]
MPLTSSSSLPLLIFRALQTLFAIIILGLSSTLIHGHKEGTLPATLGFAAIVGASSLPAALLGLAETFVHFLNEQIRNLVDGAVLLLNVAGGILLAIELHGVSCTFDGNHVDDALAMVNNDIICGGRTKTHLCYYLSERNNQALETCRATDAT